VVHLLAINVERRHLTAYEIAFSIVARNGIEESLAAKEREAEAGRITGVGN
jgi:hypothetical protein